jgi:hypothetical protein
MSEMSKNFTASKYDSSVWVLKFHGDEISEIYRDRSDRKNPFYYTTVNGKYYQDRAMKDLKQMIWNDIGDSLSLREADNRRRYGHPYNHRHSW